MQTHVAGGLCNGCGLPEAQRGHIDTVYRHGTGSRPRVAAMHRTVFQRLKRPTSREDLPDPGGASIAICRTVVFHAASAW